MTLDLDIAGGLDVIFTDLGAEATWQHAGSHSVDPSTMTETESFTPEALTVVPKLITKREVELSGGKLVQGDRKFIIRADELTGSPQSDDRVVYCGETWHLIEWEEIARAAAWRVIARKY